MHTLRVACGNARIGHSDMANTPPFICIICDKPESQQIDLYTRKSKLVRGHRQDLSTDAQREQGHRWAHRDGYAVRKVWKDIKSGYKDVERADFDKALGALAKGEVPALWAYAVDRFSRKGAEDLLRVIGKARVVFDLDGLDSNEPRDRRWIINRAEEAREYSENLSSRVRATKEEQRDAGLWVAGRAPWGYTVSRDRYLSPDETPAAEGLKSRAWYVAEIFRRVAEEGWSTRAICRWLDSEGIPSPGGTAKWRYPYVHRMLNHPAYVGWQVIQLRPGHPEAYRNAKGQRVPLVDRDGNRVSLVEGKTARAAQAAMKGLSKIPPRASRDTRPRHLLTGLARCESCGSPMSYSGKAYVCGSATGGGKHCTARASAKVASIETYVFERWLTRMMRADPQDPIMHIVSERWTARVHPEETDEEQAARAALRAAEVNLERLLTDRQSGVYDGAAARFFAPMLKDATEAVEEARAEVARHADTGTLSLPFLTGDEETIRESWNAADEPLKRDLLRLAINRVTVRKAPHQGGRFDGSTRCTIEWADYDEAQAA